MARARAKSESGGAGSLVLGVAADRNLRWAAVELTAATEEARRRHDLSPIAAAALGRAFAGAVLLQRLSARSCRKLTLTVVGDGPLVRVIAEADDAGNVRGLVGNPAAEVAPGPGGKLAIGAALGKGSLKVHRELADGTVLGEPGRAPQRRARPRPGALPGAERAGPVRGAGRRPGGPGGGAGGGRHDRGGAARRAGARARAARSEPLGTRRRFEVPPCRTARRAPRRGARGPRAGVGRTRRGAFRLLLPARRADAEALGPDRRGARRARRLISGVALCGLLWTPDRLVAALLMSVIGGGIGVFTPIAWGVLQELSPADMVGRALTLYGTGAMAAAMSGMTAFGWVTQEFGEHVSIVGIAIMMFATATVALGFSRRIYSQRNLPSRIE